MRMLLAQRPRPEVRAACKEVHPTPRNLAAGNTSTASESVANVSDNNMQIAPHDLPMVMKKETSNGTSGFEPGAPRTPLPRPVVPHNPQQLTVLTYPKLCSNV